MFSELRLSGFAIWYILLCRMVLTQSEISTGCGYRFTVDFGDSSQGTVLVQLTQDFVDLRETTLLLHSLKHLNVV